MKSNLAYVGTILGAAAAVYLVSLYMKDDEIHQKVDRTVADVKNLASAVRQRLAENKQARDYENQSRTAQNQRWADQQWEALGI